MEIIIHGLIRDEILQKLNDNFNYNGQYWIPIKKVNIDKSILVYESKKALRKRKKIEKYIKKTNKSFYLTGEIGYINPYDKTKWLQEVDFIDLVYGPIEFVYFGKNFDWLIYISHENTVTFCGEFLTKFLAKE